jgi:hypothetical protein
MRKLLVGGMLTAAAVMAPVAAWAAPGGTGHTVSLTENTHGTFDPGFDTPNPCTGAAILSADAEGNVVNHVTYFPASDEVWSTFTETGKVTVLDANHVTYTGRVTAWGGFNMNEKNSSSTFTITVRLNGSDGSSITLHEITHFTLNANGTVAVTFDRPSLTCG